MNGLASSLEISAKIIRDTKTECEARSAIWKKLIETQSGVEGRNHYAEAMVRGYLSVLKALGAPEVV